jgi:preprotein translocase subunit SecE
MNEQSQEQNAGGEVAGIAAAVLAIALLVGGIAAYYLLDARPEWQRWSAAGAGFIGGLAVFLVSPPGRRAWQFGLDSRIELRKVVWPTRQETLQTTGVVLFFMVIAGLFFWVLDLALAWLTRLATGQGG